MSKRNIIQKLFHDRVYAVCYRKVGNDFLYKNKDNDFFNLIKPNSLYWYADPFLACINGQEYIFVEKCNRITGKGIISSFEIDDNGNYINERQILKESFHLSFPNVFKYLDKYYMIPETEGDKSIIIYENGSDISTWKKLYRFDIEGIVDSAVYKQNDDLYIITSKENPNNVRQSKSVAYKISNFPLEANIKDITNTFYKENKYSYSDRNGGNIICDGDDKYRIIQNSDENIYGKNISVKKMHKNGKEEIVNNINTFDIKLKNELCKSKDMLGIHTYNTDGNYEIVDLYYEEYRLLNLFIKLLAIFYNLFKCM